MLFWVMATFWLVGGVIGAVLLITGFVRYRRTKAPVEFSRFGNACAVIAAVLGLIAIVYLFAIGASRD